MSHQWALKRAIRAIALLLTTLAWPAFGQTNTAVLHPPREVLAFYYSWYGPTRHWGKVNVAQHDIEASLRYPAQGAYDSHDPNVIDGQIASASGAGITGFIATWWGQGSYEDQAVPLLLAAARMRNFKITVYWETEPAKGADQIDKAALDLIYLVSHYGHDRAFLQVDGKPVIFIYGRVMAQIPAEAWPEIIRRAHEKAGDFLLVADGYTERNARTFDGLHTYNICGQVKDKTIAEVDAWAATSYARDVALAREHGLISCVDVIPGYNDTKIRHPDLDVDRRNGKLYGNLWEEAIRAQPDWVLITSYNEWHEGSEIEPSLELGDRYLALTAHFAPRFLQAPR